MWRAKYIISTLHTYNILNINNNEKQVDIKSACFLFRNMDSIKANLIMKKYKYKVCFKRLLT